MDMTFTSQDPLDVLCDLLIVPVAHDDGLAWTASAAAADSALGGNLAAAAALEQFRGKSETSLVLPSFSKLPAARVMLMGLGKIDEITKPGLAKSVGAALREARARGARTAVLALPDSLPGITPADALLSAAVASRMALYRFDTYRGTGSKEERHKELESLTFTASGVDEAVGSNALARAAVIAAGVNLARDLGNEPGKSLTPEAFAARAVEAGEAAGLEVEVLGPEALAELGAEAMLAVGGGSAHPPRLIRLTYTPDVAADDSRVIGLVGKAITFDTGGYSIKPYEGMLDMKSDMSGGAAVLGAMSALRAVACPYKVIGTICAAENMISGEAFRPGDVIRGMNGVTFEITSTDAEGRLVLADGLVDTARRGATEMIDLATLTGAAVVALGNGASALFATNDDMANQLLAASTAADERMWRMPLFDELESKIKGEIADLKNTGGRPGGAITAALFLRHFSEGVPWVHLDIAGAARQERASALGPKGATGVGVLTLLNYLKA
ncbi:MAG: leucyl aminopeptidase [Thermomicrobiales bacterium]|nr:leucyl aminopeptidase [Thermomicrobiales bacterium]